MILNITPPEPLGIHHTVSYFDCGQDSLNSWIKMRALKNEKHDGSRTYVICENQMVVGYYALAVGGVDHEKVPSPLKRNMPSPIPVMILARLAVDKKYQNLRLGSSLLRDATLKTLQVSKIVGIKAMMVDAISIDAKNFYEKHGFRNSPVEDRLLFATMADLQHCL